MPDRGDEIRRRLGGCENVVGRHRGRPRIAKRHATRVGANQFRDGLRRVRCRQQGCPAA
jgi:hypothetical protein